MIKLECVFIVSIDDDKVDFDKYNIDKQDSFKQPKEGLEKLLNDYVGNCEVISLKEIQ